MAEYSGRDKRLAYLFDAIENVEVDDMTGASASTDGAHGLVPAPLAGDEDKYLKGDGTWAAVQAGAGALSGLSDVDLTTPTDGQALVYDGANSKWKNGNVGGGGGSSGGSARYKEVELWSGTLKTASGTAALSDSIKNFDQILIVWTPHSSNDAIYHRITPIAVSDVILNQVAQFLLDTQWYSNQFMAYISCCFSDVQTLTISEVFNATASTDIRIIKVLGIKWETMQTALIYSTEEREVGVWTDGKPLYQKTIVYNSTNTSGSQIEQDVSSLNIDTCVYLDGFCDRSGTGYGPLWYRFNCYETDNYFAFLRYDDYNNHHNIVYKIKFGTGEITSKQVITIRYTQTTDTAGSGTWTTTGEYAHHYSTSEKVVGTWIDGKPLYEKTIDCGLITSDTSAHDIAHNISNIEKCISCNAVLIKNGEEHFANAYRPTQTVGILVWRSGANIRYINNWLGANEFRLYATLQYTKTTD